MHKPELEVIIKDIFAAFDQLANDSFFTRYLSDECHFEFHGEEFEGISGFNVWMARNRATFEPGSLYHHPYDFKYTEMAGNRYQIDFMLDFKARSLAGEAFDHTVKEQWMVDVSHNQFKIIEYIVKPS